MKENNNILVDINDMRIKKKLIEEKYHELIEMIKTYKRMIDDTKNIYDTNSANYFRKIADGYIEQVEIYLNNDFKIYIDKLDDIIKEYSNYQAINDENIKEKGDTYEV